RQRQERVNVRRCVCHTVRYIRCGYIVNGYITNGKMPPGGCPTALRFCAAERLAGAADQDAERPDELFGAAQHEPAIGEGAEAAEVEAAAAEQVEPDLGLGLIECGDPRDVEARADVRVDGLCRDRDREVRVDLPVGAVVDVVAEIGEEPVEAADQVRPAERTLGGEQVGQAELETGTDTEIGVITPAALHAG